MHKRSAAVTVRDPFWEVSDLLMIWWSRTIGSNISRLISPPLPHPKAEVGAGPRERMLPRDISGRVNRGGCWVMLFPSIESAACTDAKLHTRVTNADLIVSSDGAARPHTSWTAPMCALV